MFLKLKKSLNRVPQYFIEAMRTYPVELALIGYSYIFVILWNEKQIDSPFYLILVPLYLAIAYVCNNLLEKGYTRWVYYLSWIPLVPLSFIEMWEKWIGTPQGYISLLILCPLAVLLCRRKFDNKTFIDNTIDYLKCLFVTLFLSSIIWGAFSAIFYSTLYIFSINLPHKETNNILFYASITIYQLIAPIWFLGMLRPSFAMQTVRTKLVDTLLNFILAPALLIYTGILYLYFATIGIAWELPKGGIAYYVFGFMLCAFAVKALQQFVSIRRYEWFFGRFSWISLPALAMFWAGTIRRVVEYELTVPRIYLLICGAIMTFCIALFFTKRSGRYSYVAIFALITFGAIAYVPSLSPTQWAVHSQIERVKRLAKEVNLLDKQDRIPKSPIANTDTANLETYHQIYKALLYIDQNNEENTWIKADEFVDLLPSKHHNFLKYGHNESNDFTNKDIIIRDLRGIYTFDNRYNTCYTITFQSNDPQGDVHSKYKDKILTIQQGKKLLFSIDGEELIKAILHQGGYTLSQQYTGQAIKEIGSKGLIYQTDSAILRLNNFTINGYTEKPTITEINVMYLLLR